MHAEIREGLAAVKQRPWVAAVLLSSMAQLMLVIPACSVLLPQAMKDTGAPTATYGYVLGIGAVGGLLGALIAGHARPRRRGLVSQLALLPWVTEPVALLADAPVWVLCAAWF